MDISLEEPFFDETMILKLFGGFLGIVALIYFGFDTILNLSPTLKSLLLLSGSAGFFVASDLLKSKVLKAFLYVFSSFTYLSFLMYTIGKFSPSSEVIFTALVVSAFVFIGLGYLRSERNLRLGNNQSKAVLAVIILLILSLGVFDSTGDRPEYDLNLKQEVEIVEGQEFVMGTLEVRNGFMFSRNMDVPTLRGCVESGEESRRIYDSIESNGVIKGRGIRRFNLTDQVRPRPDANVSISGNYSIVEGKCPPEPEEDTIYVDIDTRLTEFMD